MLPKSFGDRMKKDICEIPHIWSTYPEPDDLPSKSKKTCATHLDHLEGSKNYETWHVGQKHVKECSYKVSEESEAEDHKIAKITEMPLSR